MNQSLAEVGKAVQLALSLDLYTDGVTEAQDMKGMFLGDRLGRAVQTASLHPRGMFRISGDSILGSVAAFLPWSSTVR
jgi:hypothetical protein